MKAAQLNVPVSAALVVGVDRYRHRMHLVVGVDGRNIAYMPADQVARFVDGDSALIAVSETDPRYVRPADLKAGLNKQDS